MRPEPPYTCPRIDETKDLLGSSIDDLHEILTEYTALLTDDKEMFGCRIGRVIEDLEKVKEEHLENLRDSNIELRHWGSEQGDLFNKLEIQFEDLSDDFRTAEKQITQYEDKISQLEEDLDAIYEQLQTKEDET